MYAVTTLFDLNRQPAFAQMWQKLQNECGLVTANEVSFVHLSWQGAQAYHMEPVRARLNDIAGKTHSFKVRVAGIGMFTGPEPVLYLNLVKNRSLLELHEVLWEGMLPHAKEMNAYYAPEEWVPHVTLVYGILLPEDLACAVKGLMYQPLSAELDIDNLAMIFLHDGSVGIDSRYRLSPQS